MKIFAMDVSTSQLEEIEVESSTKISDLKSKIKDALNIRTVDQKLTHNTTEITDNNKTVGDYSIVANNTILVANIYNYGY